MEPETRSKRRVLIVDDDLRVVQTMAQGLKELAVLEITSCTSGQSAREALTQAPFDLIVSDLRMPDDDGISLLTSARETSPSTITILMTAFPSPEVETLASDSDIKHLLIKPFELDDLIGIIRSVFPESVAPPAPNKAQVLKVILGGDANVGKTSLIHRFCTGEFDPTRAMTIGIDFHVYDVAVEQGRARLVVWDLGGQERFAPARQAFYRGSKAVALVFDASNRHSFYNLMRWWREVRQFLQNVPVVLLANKVDLPRQVSRQEAEVLSKAWNIPFYETSCANGAGVTEFFDALADLAYRHATQPRVEKTRA